MKARRKDFGLQIWGVSPAISLGVVLSVVAACGGDDTEVVPLGDSGRDSRQEAGAPDRVDSSTTGSGGVGGTGGTGGTGGASGGASGTGGTSGTAGASGRDGSAGAAGSAGMGGRAGAAGSGGGGGVDSGTGDADASSTPDADAGQLPDGSDASVQDADADSGPPPVTIQGFQQAIAAAWCERVRECCGIADPDFDRSKCESSQGTGFGPDRVNTYLRQYSPDAGFPSSIQFSAQQAATCIALERNRKCTDSDGAERALIYNTCVGALQGTMGNGSTGCKTSAECAGSGSGLFCQASTDGGPNTCAPVSGLNGACSDINRNSDQCRYLGTYQPNALYCNPFGGTGTCQQTKGLGLPCSNGQECASECCSLVSGTCVSSQPSYPGAPACTAYTKVPEAGTD